MEFKEKLISSHLAFEEDLDLYEIPFMKQDLNVFKNFLKKKVSRLKNMKLGNTLP